MISNAEIATALRPFYFVVHPDLFGRYPQQRVIGVFFIIIYLKIILQLIFFLCQSTNEESLKHLSAHLEAMQHHRTLTSSPRNLSFYIRNSDAAEKDRGKISYTIKKKLK